ncbi:MAG: NAD(P)H-flavin reductase [Gammaproteobacteria bacterium]
MLTHILTETHFYQAISLTEWQGDVVQVLLRPITKHPLNYQAGQYIHVAYPSGNWLPLSIANAPRADHVIELHIRHRPEDIETRELLNKLQQDRQINLTGPFGHAVYHRTPHLPLILLAGGTGIAPLKALLEQAATLNDRRRWHLYWSVRTAADFYLPVLALQWQSRLNLTEIRIVSQPSSTTWAGRVGYAHDAVLQDHANLAYYQVYASGPSAMVAAAYRSFIQHGLSAERFYSDMI